jgi:ADP-heptose:LPS heptosyltransferase
MAAAPRRILVIKLGALGDVVLALGPMAAIRQHHAGAHITVLTTTPYAAFLAASAFADAVWIDDRPGWTRPWAVLALARRLRAGGFERVYDLQTSDRSSFYFRLIGRPAWSGIARGCSLPHDDPGRDRLHTLDRQRAQLAIAGIADVPPPDLGWADAPIGHLGLRAPFALLVAGGAAHRPAKRWPVEHFGALARVLVARGIQPVLVGTAAEADVIAAVRGACPAALDLGGRTSLVELATVARGAALAIGNDSGPMHLAAAAGCPSLVLFSAASDPALTAPRGAHVRVLREARLADLAVERVVAGGLDSGPVRAEVPGP